MKIGVCTLRIGDEFKHRSRLCYDTLKRYCDKQNYDLINNLPLEIYNDLSLEEKSIMGYCSHPPKNEYDRIDIKAGYEILKLKNKIKANISVNFRLSLELLDAQGSPTIQNT